MTIAETIYRESLGLPEEKAQEVLAFIESLKAAPRSMELDTIREDARAVLSGTRIDFGGKPMSNREEANARL